MAVPNEIAEQIATLMVADSDLNSIDMVYIGAPYAVPGQYDRWAVVVIDAEQTEQALTGNKVFRTYAGAIVVNVRQRDTFSAVGATGRIEKVDSYADCNALTDTIVRLFKTTANRSLNNLAVTGGAVHDFAVGEPGIEYGLAAEQDRDNAYLQFGIIPFECETLETMDS